MSIKLLQDGCLPLGSTYKLVNSTKLDIDEEEEGVFERNS